MTDLQVSMVLREMQVLRKKIEALEKRREGIRHTIRSLQGKCDAVTDQLIPLSGRAEKLARVADIMSEDWRTWEWVQEAELDKAFPRRES